ncbi:MAG TPA: oxidoreductase [Bacteroidales bacterium]|nr:oxidoreductase [Bacteroidales bacterium]
MAEFRIEEVPSQNGKIAIVTGANTGLGFETTKGLARTGMKVIMACRDIEKAQTAKGKILKEQPFADLEIMIVDLSRFVSIRKFAGSYLARYKSLDLLVNNAGIMIPPYCKMEDGFESQFGVNYLSHFLLTGLLFDTLEKTPASRIVALASNAHRNATIDFDDLNWEKRKYSPLSAYGQSKLACLVFAFELNRRILGNGFHTKAAAAHPGVSVTELVRHIPKLVMLLGKPVTALLTHSPEKGAMPVLMAALNPDVKGGEYYGPQGYHEWTGKPGLAKSTALANDEALAKRLWDISEKLTGVKYP